MTLDEMLALLPDNTAGEISAADLRTIVAELHKVASTHANVFPFRWTNNAAPGSGAVNVNAWSMAATEVRISETTDDGVLLGFTLLDGAEQDVIRLHSGDNQLTAEVTGPTVDQGTYRTVPIAVTEAVGSAPSNNAAVSVTLLVVTE